MIGLFAVHPAGRRAAADLAARLGADAVVVDGPIGPALRRTWSDLDSAVFFSSTGQTVRLLAPFLRDRHTDPGVVCVDDAARFAVALAGGRSGGADALAEQVADVLGCTPVVTTGEDSIAGTPLDEVVDLLDATVDGDLPRCGRAIADGAPTRLVNPHGFALPALPDNVTADQPRPEWTVVVDDRRADAPDPDTTVRLVPRTLVIGVGASRGVARAAVTSLVARLDSEYGLDQRAVRAFATADHKAGEDGIREAVQDIGFWHSAHSGDELPLLECSAADLDAVEVPNPSALVRARTGVGSVAEAAALHGAADLSGTGSPESAELVVAKIAGSGATVAVARIRPRGRLAIIGAGPGEADLRTPRADAELRRAAIVLGPEQCLDQLRPLLRQGTDVRVGVPGSVEAEALALARSGHAVALVGPGDAAHFRAHAVRVADVDIVHVPGIALA